MSAGSLTQPGSLGGSALEIEGVRKQFGGAEVVKGVSIGIGPGSSHTVGPMRAARMFVKRLDNEARYPG